MAIVPHRRYYMLLDIYPSGIFVELFVRTLLCMYIGRYTMDNDAKCSLNIVDFTVGQSAPDVDAAVKFIFHARYIFESVNQRERGREKSIGILVGKFSLHQG